MTRRLVAIAVAILPALALLASGSCTTKFKPPPNAPGLMRAVTPDSVQVIFTNHCAEVPGCHTGQFPTGNQDLSVDSSYAMIVNHPSRACAPLMRVRPFRPDSSCIMQRITGRVTPQMPLGGPYLTPADTSTIFNWIKAGAPAKLIPA